MPRLTTEERLRADIERADLEVERAKTRLADRTAAVKAADAAQASAEILFDEAKAKRDRLRAALAALVIPASPAEGGEA